MGTNVTKTGNTTTEAPPSTETTSGAELGHAGPSTKVKPRNLGGFTLDTPKSNLTTATAGSVGSVPIGSTATAQRTMSSVNELKNVLGQPVKNKFEATLRQNPTFGGRVVLTLTRDPATNRCQISAFEFSEQFTGSATEKAQFQRDVSIQIARILATTNVQIDQTEIVLPYYLGSGS